MSTRVRKGKLIRQINNLSIHFDANALPGHQYMVWSVTRIRFGDRFLESFRTQAAAEDWCRRTTDFLRRKVK